MISVDPASNPPDERASSPATATQRLMSQGPVRVEEAGLTATRALFSHVLASATLLEDEDKDELRRILAEIEALLARPRLTLAVIGSDARARREALNALLGGAYLDPAGGNVPGTRMCFRHGAEPGYVARLSSGEVEELAREVPDESAPNRAGRADAEAALDECYEMLIALRAQEERLEPTPERSVEDEPARLARVSEERARVVARIDELQGELARLDAELLAHRDARRRALEAKIRSLSSGPRNADVAELVVDLPALPSALTLLDVTLTGEADEIARGWKLVAREADACLLAGGGALPREARDLFGGAVPLLPVDSITEVLSRARLLRVARLTGEAAAVGLRALRAARARVEHDLERGRAAADAERAALAAVLDKRCAELEWSVSERVYLAILQARAITDRELDGLGERWLERLRSAGSPAELRTLVERATRDLPAELELVCGEARQIFSSTLAGGVRDLVPALLERVADEHDPAVGEVLSSAELGDLLAIDLGATEPWPLSTALSARRGTFERLRQDCVDALEAELIALRRNATATLLSFEPRAHAGLAAALRRAKAAACGQRESRLAARVEDARRRAEGDLEREAELYRDLASLAERVSRMQELLAAELVRLKRWIRAE